MTGRRNLLKAAVGAGSLRSDSWAALPPQAVLRQARAKIRSGALGRVGYCRLEHSGLVAPAKYVLDEESRNCVIEVGPATQEIVFLGSRATLVVTPQGFRLFAADAQSAT